MDVVIGDIHGCFAELNMLLDRIGPASGDRIITLGDMVDRGPDSPGVVGFFMDRPHALSLLGNHERKHLRVYRHRMSERDFGKTQQLTVRQFEQSSPDLYREAIAYFETLPLFLDLSEAFLVHGGVEYNKPLEEQDEKILTGAGFHKQNQRTSSGLFGWCDSYPLDAKPVICGHLGIGRAPWPLPQRGNIYPIDTGCCSGGYITAVTLPNFKVYQIRSLQPEKHRKPHYKTLRTRRVF